MRDIAPAALRALPPELSCRVYILKDTNKPAEVVVVDVPANKDPFDVLEQIGRRHAAATQSTTPAGATARPPRSLPSDASVRPSLTRPAGVRDASMQAYRQLVASGKLGAQQRRIVEHFLAHPGARFTRQELARDTGLTINATCGRVAELMAEPFGVLLERDPRKRCTVTQNEVNALELAA